ncbi:uncharacterized protein LOC133796268 [Humulus lupulus]|uniref:uncharacterized protein LOC133796268 n=1 Tax=Humulus lupulus TaxID=3486 RepID=UPI002B413C0D|nr:uncharacterized protein LOC133796268 [Humulus lupulus]
MTNLPTDPALRPPISNYHPNIQDEIRRNYLQQGPCQPRSQEFPKKFYGAKERRFNIALFDQFSTWLEYSISKNYAFFLCCYLFKSSIGKQAGGNTFVSEGFSNWKKMSLLEAHVVNHNSSHYKCYKICEALIDGKQQIEHLFLKKNIKDRISYRVRLIASTDCIRFLVRQGLAFRGHDESQESNNQGNFLEFLTFLANHNDEVRAIALKNAPENLKLNSPKIQKDIVNACAMETINVIIRDMGDVAFSILVDESRDIAIDKLFSKHGLSISKLRGQEYDGASNMSEEFNGLKSIIMKENECTFLTVVSKVVNVVGASSKRRDILQEKQALKVIEALNDGYLLSGRGQNQESGIKRPCDTHWGSHYGTLVSFTIMFSSIIDVLEKITNDRLNSEQKYEASIMLQMVQTYNFSLSLHLVKNILGITNELSQVLQKGDQDIVNHAMDLVKICKKQLQMTKDNRWDSLVEEFSNFCMKFNIYVLDMNHMYCTQGKSRRKAPKLTNFHYFCVDFFNTMIDLKLQELSRFNEANIELLLCLACLSPANSFSTFDKGKLIRLAQLYPCDFSTMDINVLEYQLQTYVDDMRLMLSFQL